MPPTPLTNLADIAAFAASHEAENDRFTVFLKQQPTEVVDEAVATLNEAIAPQIDCTACGNCCKTLMINVTDERADALAEHLHQSRAVFDKNYLETGGSGMMVINAIPCTFLSENRCTVYDYRFDGCREFPALHLPLINRRLFTLFMHYGRCPIIFNVMEALKEAMWQERGLPPINHKG